MKIGERMMVLETRVDLNLKELYSFHGTFMYVADKMLKMHEDSVSDLNVHYEMNGIQVALYLEDGEGKIAFIREIDKDGHIELGEKRKAFAALTNANGKVSIKIGNLFLSARKDGSVKLVTQNADYEQYIDYNLYLKNKENKRTEVYDCFPFFNEYETLELRLSLLDDYVDHFVIVEMDRTQNNEEKGWNYLKEKDRFKKYAAKIRYIRVTDELPYKGMGDNTLEHFQRQCIMRGLNDARPDDFVFISDCDEIWDPETFEKIKNNEVEYYINIGRRTEQKFSSDFEYKLKPTESAKLLDFFPIAFRQKLYKYHINWRFDTVPWNGTVLIRKKNIEYWPSLNRIRGDKYSHAMVKDGGWHFTWQGGTERLKTKFKSIFEGSIKASKNDEYVETLVSMGQKGESFVEESFDEIGIGADLKKFCMKYPKFYGNKSLYQLAYYGLDTEKLAAFVLNGLETNMDELHELLLDGNFDEIEKRLPFEALQYFWQNRFCFLALRKTNVYGGGAKQHVLVVPGRAAVAVQLKDFRSIVDQLEGGARAIYITDAAGIYRFMAITVGQKIWKKDNGQWVMPFRSVLPVSSYAHLSVDDLPDLAGEAEGVLKKQPDVKEVPIVNARGEVVGLACSVENWQKEKTSDISSDDKWLDKKIYISSLKNPLLRKLYHDFHGCLDMVPLSQDNWQSVLSGESDGVLAYETDIFPNCPKAEVGRLYKLLCSHFRDR